MEQGMSDYWAFRYAHTSADENRKRIEDAARKMRVDGATWLRVTRVNAEHKPGEPYFGFWIEGWRVRPDVEPEFEPPLMMVVGK